MQPVYSKRPSALDQRSVMTVLIVLLLGAVLGFGVGYKYEKTKKSINAKGNVAAASAARRRQAAMRGAQGKARIINCMATKGVKYTSRTADLSRPPAGVAHNAYQIALAACYRAVAAHRSG